MRSRQSAAVSFLTCILLLVLDIPIVHGKGDIRLLNTVHPTMGRLLGRMQRGEQEILLYENGEIAVDKLADDLPPAASRPAPPTPPRPTPHLPAATAPTTAPPRSVRLPPSSPPQPRPYELPTLDDYDPWTSPDPPAETNAPDEAPQPVASTNTSTAAEAQEVITALVARLADPNIGVRHEARQALVRMGAAAVAPLMDALRQPGQPDHAYKAEVNVLGELRDPRAVALLSEKLVAEDFSARLETVKALGAIGDSAAAPALLKAITMNEYSAEIRAAAYKALGETKSKIAIRPLMRAVHLDRYDICQAEAMAALDLITGQKFGRDNIRRTAWLKEHHPDWLEASPDTVVDKRFLGIVKLFAAGILIASGIGILLVTR